MPFRKCHIEGAVWASRARLPNLLSNANRPRLIVLVTDEPDVAALVASDLRTHGFDPHLLIGDAAEWEAANLTSVANPADPPDDECIDFVFFTHDRHSGNLDAARRYLAWETGLVSQLEANERALFRL